MSSTARDPAPDPTDGVGIAFALAAAVGFGLAIAVSRFAYEGGTNGFTVASFRSCVATLVVLALCLVTGRSIRVTRREWLHLTGLGVLLSVLFYGNVGAVEYISVGLTALLLFTFPTMIATMESMLTRTMPAPAKATALVVAFAGLFLMLGVSFGSSHPLGIALALSAALAAATNAVWYSRAVRHVDIVVATLHMTIAATVTVLVVSVLYGSFVPPVNAIGWGGLIGVAILQSGIAPVYFAGIARIGPGQERHAREHSARDEHRRRVSALRRMADAGSAAGRHDGHRRHTDHAAARCARGGGSYLTRQEPSQRAPCSRAGLISECFSSSTRRSSGTSPPVASAEIVRATAGDVWMS